MPDTNDVLLVATYNSTGNTSDIPTTTIYTVSTDGFYACALYFKWTEVGGTNYQVYASPFASIGATGGATSGNQTAPPTWLYLTSGTVVQVFSNSNGNPPPTSINFDFRVRIIQLG